MASHEQGTARPRAHRLDGSSEAWDAQKPHQPHSDTEKDELFKQIGQLEVELDFLKKKQQALACSNEQKRQWIDPAHPELSVSRQCELLGLARSSYCSDLVGGESAANLRLHRKLDKLYMELPVLREPANAVTLGINRTHCQWLRLATGKHIRQLLRRQLFPKGHQVRMNAILFASTATFAFRQGG